MTWTVQKQKRKERGYYSAVFTPAHGERRSVTLGYLPGDPVTAAMTARLRRFDPHGHWQKDTLVSVLAASTDETAAQAAIFRPMMSQPLSALVPRDLSPAEERALLSMMALDLAAGRGGWYDAVKNTTLTALAEQIGKLDPPAPAPPAAPAAPIVVVAPPPPPRPVIVPPDPRGTMTLDRYFQEVWAPIRRLTASWKRDAWWFDYRILPVLGEVRICDLNEPAWTALVQGLTVSGSSKRLCQNAYRCALTHAVDNLGWVAQLHRFKPIPGSTKAALAEPEPLEHVEVTALLNAAPSAMHRALFGTQIGQGLRPKEVIRLKWEHVNWRARTLYVEGTKNQLAAATVAMTPRTLQALRPWWEERGRPLDGPMFVSGETLKPLEEFPKAVLRRAAERAGLNDDRKRKVFPYLARHTFATLAAADGIQPAHTRRMMRHSSASSVMERAYEKATLKQVSGAFATFGREGDGAWDW